jgi:hypothetical protein
MFVISTMEVWKDCVAVAKKGDGRYGFLPSTVFKKAQTAYCAIQVTQKNK